MKHRYTLSHFSNTYEIVVDPARNTIVRITKTLGESGMTRNCSYESLPLAVKQELHEQINDNEAT